jgi:hypothetical protein
MSRSRAFVLDPSQPTSKALYLLQSKYMNLLYHEFTRSRQLHIHDWNTQLRETGQVIVLGKHEWSTIVIPEWWICKLLSSSPFVRPMMIASPLLEKNPPPKPWVEASLYRISKPTNHERIVDLDRSSKQVKTTPMQAQIPSKSQGKLRSMDSGSMI